MNKSELAKQIAERMNISHSDSLRYLNTSGKRMLEKLNPTLRAIVCLLFLPFLTGCSDEQQPASGEWIPVEINVAGIEQIEISSMGTKAWDTEQPSIVKTAFTEGDELNLTYTEDGNTITVPFKLNSDGKWGKKDGTQFMIRASAGTPPIIKAEFGTAIPDAPGYNTTDYLFAEVTPAYNDGTNTYTCNFSQFKRPEDYVCLYIKILILNTPDNWAGNNEVLYFTSAKFYTDPDENGTTPLFPINDEIINVFYKGAFSAYGVYLTPMMSGWYDEINIPLFNDYDNNGDETHVDFTPGSLTPVQLIIPFPR